ncbi:MAG: Ig-like domain-containing protein [Gemmatimonadetes bacterium]|nr:Ig-like domain-containing protein [Gemmatimonadota bacterium]
MTTNWTRLPRRARSLSAAVFLCAPAVACSPSDGNQQSIVTPTPPPPSVVAVASVAISPPNASILVGGTATFTATPRDSTGANLSGRTVSWLSSNGGVASVSSAGVVTGLSAGTTTITATSEGKTSPGATVTVTTPITGATTADPSQLPNASGQLKNTTAYTALNIPTMAAGGSYLDPVTGVKIWKMTSATVPVANPLMHHNYSEGPAQISREYSGKHTLWIDGPTGGVYFVDFKRGVGFSNYRPAPAGTAVASFSFNPATPSICYLVSTSGSLRRFDVSNDTYVDVAPFPVALGGASWFQSDMNDNIFAVISATSTNDVTVFNRSTGVKTTKTFAGLDEPYLERNGRYLMANTSLTAVSIWDVTTNAVTALAAPGGSIFAHVGITRGYFIAGDPNTGGGKTPMWAVDPSAPLSSFIFSNLNGYYPDAHTSGMWAPTDAELGGPGNLKKQWILREQYDATIPGTGTGVKEGFAMLTLDGLNFKIVAHHYSVIPAAGAPNSMNYYSAPRSTMSVDGKLIMFDSNMNGTARTDVFIIEVPIH